MGDRPLGLVAVVIALELQLATLDAAVAVGLRERGQEAGAHALAQGAGRTVEGGRLAEQDGVGAYARLGLSRPRSTEGESERAGRRQNAF